MARGGLDSSCPCRFPLPALSLAFLPSSHHVRSLVIVSALKFVHSPSPLEHSSCSCLPSPSLRPPPPRPWLHAPPQAHLNQAWRRSQEAPPSVVRARHHSGPVAPHCHKGLGGDSGGFIMTGRLGVLGACRSRMERQTQACVGVRSAMGCKRTVVLTRRAAPHTQLRETKTKEKRPCFRCSMRKRGNHGVSTEAKVFS